MPELSQRICAIVADGSDGWGIYYEARRRQAAGQPIVMLSIGDHDVKTAPEILAAMQRSAEGGNLGYAAAAGSAALRQAIAARYRSLVSVPVEADNITVTSGGQGAIFAAMNAVLDPGDACVVLDPYYASFDITVRSVAAHPIIVPTSADEGFQPDVGLIEKSLTPQTKAILINTPNNPSGAVYERPRLEALADLCCRRDLWLISDELYDCQVHDGDHVSPRDLPGMAERTIVIGSMSKGYAMTGSRIGWAIAPTDATRVMIDLAGATTYGLPGFLQDAAIFALQERAGLEAEIAGRYRRRRDLAVKAIGNTPGIKISPPEGGMYVMLDIRETGLSGIEFAACLLDRHLIGVMPGESFGSAAAGHVRVALTVDDESLAKAMGTIASFAAEIARP